MLRPMPYLTLTDDNFQPTVLDAQEPVLVDCWASWCHPRPRVDPALQQLLETFTGTITIGRLNIAAADRIARRYEIRAVPTLLLFSHGSIVERVTGAVPYDAIAQTLSTLIHNRHANRSFIGCL